jgi:hypothetical protein
MLNGLCVQSSRTGAARQASSDLLVDFFGDIQVHKVGRDFVIFQLGGLWDSGIWMFRLKDVYDMLPCLLINIVRE